MLCKITYKYDGTHSEYSTYDQPQRALRDLAVVNKNWTGMHVTEIMVTKLTVTESAHADSLQFVWETEEDEQEETDDDDPDDDSCGCVFCTDD
jgi:hypothetical protein